MRNSGTITAKLGTVALGAGNLFNLDFYGDRLITLGVGDQIATQVRDVATGQTLKSLITNEGKLKANGGRVELTAAPPAKSSIPSSIRRVLLRLDRAAGRQSYAECRHQFEQAWNDNPSKNTSSRHALSFRQAQGVAGENIEVSGATIDASGRDGGGKVLIGGDWAGGKATRRLRFFH